MLFQILIDSPQICVIFIEILSKPCVLSALNIILNYTEGSFFSTGFVRKWRQRTTQKKSLNRLAFVQKSEAISH